jgi:hypothetical protein
MNKFILALLILGGLAVTAAFSPPSTAAIPESPTQAQIPYPLWSIEEVAASGYAHALALDSAGRPHLLYHDVADGMLRHAVRYNSGWSFDNVAGVTTLHPDLSFDLAIAPDGSPCIVYATAAPVISYPADTTLTYGCRKGNNWQLTAIDDGGREVALALDSQSQPHIALIQDQEAVYFTLEEGAWVREIVGEDSAYMGMVWLTLDGLERPRLIFSGSAGIYEAVRQTAQLWTIANFPLPGLHARVLDEADRSWVLLTESEPQSGHPPFSFNRLLLAVPDGAGGWTNAMLDEDYDWQIAADLVVSGSDTAHVAFRDVSGSLHYRWWSAFDGWESHQPDAFADADLHLALGDDGQPRLSFGSGGQVYLATRRIVMLDHSLFMPVSAGSLQ